MRQIGDYVSRLLRIGQGLQWLVSIGSAVLSSSLLAGWLAAYSGLPPWAVVLSLLGTFLIVLGIAAAILERFFPESRLTPVIRSGEALAARMRAVIEVEPTEAMRVEWRVRYSDWKQSAEDVIKEVAPGRLGAFRVDVLMPDGMDIGAVHWLVSNLADLEMYVERLRQIRASL